MRERPILMSAPMVRATLEDRKTKTRRVFMVTGPMGKAYPVTAPEEEIQQWEDGSFHYLSTGGLSGPYPCPYGVPGDRLWVREAWRTLQKWDALKPSQLANDRSKVTYEADPENRNPLWAFGRLRPGMFMPRWACRLVLELTDVRVERLQDCSHADARAEGIVQEHHVWRDCEYPLPDAAYRGWPGAPTRFSDAVDAYRDLWDHINGARPGCTWADNPWVWVLGFKRVQP